MEGRQLDLTTREVDEGDGGKRTVPLSVVRFSLEVVASRRKGRVKEGKKNGPSWK
jgi:hypothetical protein